MIQKVTRLKPIPEPRVPEGMTGSDTKYVQFHLSSLETLKSHDPGI